MAMIWSRPIPDWDRENWRAGAACRQSDPDLFFPAGGTTTAATQIKTAKAICARCPVKAACLEFAFVANQEAGVWGGTSEEERRRMRKAWLARRRQGLAAR